MAVAFTTEPSGARLPTGKTAVPERPRRRASSGAMITSSASMPSASRSRSFIRRRRALASHQSRDWSRVSPVAVSTSRWRRPMRRRWSRTSGTPPARNTRTVGWLRGPLGSASTSRGVARLARCQSATVGVRRPGGVRDGGQVEHEVGRAAEGGVGQHRVLDRVRGEDARERDAEGRQPHQGEGRAPGGVQPHRLARRSERRVGEREAEGLAHHLRGGGGAEELAAPARRAAGAAGQGRGVFEGHEAVGEPRAQRLHRARVLAARRWAGSPRRARSRPAGRGIPRGPAWWRAGPCRRSRRRARPRGAAASGSAAA